MGWILVFGASGADALSFRFKEYLALGIYHGIDHM